MREVLEAQPGLHIRQAEVVDLVLEETGSGIADPSEDHGRPRPQSAGPQAAGWAPVAGRSHHHHHWNLSERTDSLRRRALSGRTQRRACQRSSRRGRCGRWAFAPAGSRPGHRRGSTVRTIRWDAFEEQPGDADPTPFSFRTREDRAATNKLPYCLYHAGNTAPDS